MITKDSVVYIAGPMTGMLEFNQPAFHSMEEKIRSKFGCRVLNPATIDNGSTYKPREYYLQIALRMLLGCDKVVFLDGWEHSDGACLELNIAQELGMEVYDKHFKLMSGGSGVPDTEPWKIHTDWKPAQFDKGMACESVCQQADRIVSEDRMKEYGHPADDFSKTAALWTGLFSDILQPNCQFTASDIPKAMICVKLSRLMNRYKRDSATDICGYAKTLDMVENYEK